MMTQISLNTT